MDYGICQLGNDEGKVACQLEQVLPAAAAVTVSLAGFLFAKYITAKYDQSQSKDQNDFEPSGNGVVTADIEDVKTALVSAGINKNQLSEALEKSTRETVNIPVKIL